MTIWIITQDDIGQHWNSMNKNVTQIATRQHATSWFTRVWKIGCESVEWIDELS
jgi:hypothetical protein